MTHRTLFRTTACLLAAAGSLSGCASSSDARRGSAGFAPEDVPRYSAEQFYNTVSVTGGSFSPDGTDILVSSNQSGVFNAYAVNIETSEKERLTESDSDAIFARSYFPRDRRIVYTADAGGNELSHVFVRELDGEVRDLTPGENVRAIFAGFSHDGDSFFVLTNERDPRFMDAYRFDAETYARELMYQPEPGMDVAGVSRNERYVALQRVNSNADSDVFVVDLQAPTAEPVHVTPHEGMVQHGVMSFTPDSQRLLYSSNEGSEWNRVWSYNLTTGQRELYLEADWDVMYVSFSHDGRYRYHAVNADAKTELTVTDMRTGKELALPDLPAGDIVGVTFPRTGVAPGKMAFYATSDTAPPNLFVMDLGSGAISQLTDTLNPAIDQRWLVDAEVVRYRSFDEEEIPSVLYRPKFASHDHPVPALVWVHGGPGGQSRQGYNPLMQFLANHGYAVLAVNNRGSSGYGKTFFHMDDRDHGGGDLQDCVQGRAYLESLPWIDGERVGIIGGSYGGYMVCAALAFEPQAFEVGINIFGVTNWIRTLESIPSWWENYRKALYAELGDPSVPEDRARLEARSPLLHAENIEKPLLVVQGANDPRVLKVESDDIVERVRANGVPVEYVVFEDEGHGFLNRENRIEAAEAYIDFLMQYMPPKWTEDSEDERRADAN